MSRPLARSGQWSQTTTGDSQPADRLMAKNKTWVKEVAMPLATLDIAFGQKHH